MLKPLFAALAMLAAPAALQAAPDLTTMHMTFFDEFTSATLDHTKWETNKFHPEPLNEPIQVYLPEQVIPDATAGVVHLRAEKKAYLDRAYSSGMISTAHHFSQRYGYWEMRAQLVKGMGMLPAFRLLPEDGDWPPIVNIMEEPGQKPNKSSSTASRTTDDHVYQATYLPPGVPTFDAAFHTFGAEWTPGLIIYYVDGVETFRATGKYVPDAPMFMIANLNVGGGYGNVNGTTVFPQDMAVDYIRVYQYNNTADAVPTFPDVTAVGLSDRTPKAGTTVTLNLTIKAGDDAISDEALTVELFDFYNDKPAIATVKTAKITLGAHASTAITVPVMLPATLMNAVYNLSVNGDGISAPIVTSFRVLTGP